MLKKESLTIIKKLPGTTQLKKYLSKYLPLSAGSKKHNLSPLIIRPFTFEDLKPIPEGWQVTGPHFVGIASGKAGTSWWYSLLCEHPQVVKNRLNTKELSYFQHFRYWGLNEEQMLIYRMAFAAPEGAISGEWSPGYILHPFCAEYLAKVAPDVKILVLLRNPIDRALSSINQRLQTYVKYFDFDLEKQNVYEVFDLQRLTLTGYTQGLRRFLKYFPRNQILLLQYEKCKVDPYTEIARTYRFLGIDDQYKPQNVKRSVNKKNYAIPLLKPEERQRLTSYFFDDVKVVTEMFPEIDLSLWHDFAN
jgi:hypothetical protein